ncbi:MAG: NUDIX hydrolase [Dermatophilaceae bacterium]|nr:NUDIX domain-containing protein [Intrasporangiaceae bacterium]
MSGPADGFAEGVAPRRSPAWRDAVTTLRRFEPADSEQAELRTAYLDALGDDTAVFKAGPPVHLTASCIVFDHRSERVLLTLHTKAHAWLQFGGHVEATDPTLYAAADREVREESGIDAVAVDPRIVDLHRHSLGARFGRCAAHLDVRFAGWAPVGAEPRRSSESLDVRWWPIEALPDDVVADLGILITRGQDLARDRAVIEG